MLFHLTDIRAHRCLREEIIDERYAHELNEGLRITEPEKIWIPDHLRGEDSREHREKEAEHASV